MEALRRPVVAREEQVRDQHSAHQDHTAPERALQCRRNKGRQSVAGQRGANIRICSAAIGCPRVAGQADCTTVEWTHRRGGPQRAGSRWNGKPRSLDFRPELIHPSLTARLQDGASRRKGPASPPHSRRLPFYMRFHHPNKPASRFMGLRIKLA